MLADKGQTSTEFTGGVGGFGENRGGGGEGQVSHDELRLLVEGTGCFLEASFT